MPPVRHFLNKKTKIVWEVADEATLKRLLADPINYEEAKVLADPVSVAAVPEEPPGAKGGKK